MDRRATGLEEPNRGTGPQNPSAANADPYVLWWMGMRQGGWLLLLSMCLHKRYVLCFLLLVTAATLDCPILYDYSSGLVKCATSCASDTRHQEKNCCGPQHYYFKGRCHLCNGWILNDGNACCRYGTHTNIFRRVLFHDQGQMLAMPLWNPPWWRQMQLAMLISGHG